MINYFLDTNIIIDFLGDRKPFSQQAATLFDASIEGKVKLHVAAISYNNIYYVLRKTLGHIQTLSLLTDLMEMTEVADLTGPVLQKALITGFNDFEDAIQYQSARSLNIVDAIVTRNYKDFKSASLPLLSPSEAVALIGM